MAKGVNQKLKMLYILQMLQEDSSEEHPLSTKDLIARLAANDISAERKSIYDDINQLMEYGYDVIQVHSRTNGGYYLASRDFQVAELKLLVDAVQSSRFITPKKTRELIKKLERQTNKWEAGQLQRQVYITGRTKTENESIYYAVDTIYKAIHNNVQLSFQYLEWTTLRELKPKKQGQRYQVSPWALLWQDENYYLAAFDAKARVMKHYRVDKMGSTAVTDQKREGLEEFQGMDLGKYVNRTFGMFGGTVEQISLQLPDHLVGVVLDRFGRDVDMKKLEKDFFSIRISAAVSSQFFGWLAGIGPEVKILSPERVKEEYKLYLQKILDCQ